MNDAGLSAALDRADRALARIADALERSLQKRRSSGSREDQLRDRIREAVAELDQLIREAV